MKVSIMRWFLKVLTIAIIFSTPMTVASCGKQRTPSSRQAEETEKLTPGSDMILRNRGKVIVALLGMQGCPGTEHATLFLEKYSKTRPEGVFACRIDVPVPGKRVERAGNISSSVNYALDDGRVIAGRLEFFFYPTLYILDREGLVRFAGGCEADRVEAMVSEILSEKPGMEKKMYSAPLAKVGDIIPDFKIPTAEGGETSMDALCKDSGAILYFSSTACGFSMEALADIERLKKNFASNRWEYAIISFGEDAKTIGNVYSEKSAGTKVVMDVDKSLSEKYFGVSAVPFFFVLDKNRKVVDRRPFVYETARAAIAKALGVAGGNSCGTAGSTGAG